MLIKRIGFVEELIVKEKMYVVVFVFDGIILEVLLERVVLKFKEIKRKVVDRSKYNVICVG